MAAGPKILARHMNKKIDKRIHLIARTARDKAAKAHTQLTNSIQPRMVSPFEGQVSVGMDYGQAVEEGTGIYGPLGQASGKMPPRNAIMDWIKVRRVEPQDTSMDLEDLEFLIARKIATTGTRPQPFLIPAAEEHEAGTIRDMNKAVDDSLAEMAR